MSALGMDDATFKYVYLIPMLWLSKLRQLRLVAKVFKTVATFFDILLLYITLIFLYILLSLDAILSSAT